MMAERMVQFSIFLGNKPGMLGTVCRELGRAKINIVAMTMMDAAEHGVLRMIAADAERARATLKNLEVPTSEAEVLTVTMPNRPGAVADVCERLSESRVPISYLYCTTGAAGGKTIGVFKVDNIAKAIKVVEAHRPAGRDMRVKLRNMQRTRMSGRA
jgi:hypothetical protein